MEHIGLIGLVLSSPPEEGWLLARHLADYVLVWAQSDVDKSGHMARIADAAHRGHCGEPSCDQFGIRPSGQVICG